MRMVWQWIRGATVPSSDRPSRQWSRRASTHRRGQLSLRPRQPSYSASLSNRHRRRRCGRRSPLDDASSATEDEEEAERASRRRRGRQNGGDANVLFLDSSSSSSSSSVRSSQSTETSTRRDRSTVGSPRGRKCARSPPLLSSCSRRTRRRRREERGSEGDTKDGPHAIGAQGRRSVLSRFFCWGNHPHDALQDRVSREPSTSSPECHSLSSTVDSTAGHLPSCPSQPARACFSSDTILARVSPPVLRPVWTPLAEEEEKRTTPLSSEKEKEGHAPLSRAAPGAPGGRNHNATVKNNNNKTKKHSEPNDDGSLEETIPCPAEEEERQTHPSFSSPKKAIPGASHAWEAEAPKRGIIGQRWSSPSAKEDNDAFHATEKEGKREYSLRSGFPVWKAIPAFFRAVATRALDFDDDERDEEEPLYERK